MQQSYKSALYSALLFPGSGQLSLKHYPSGLLFAGTAIACLCALVFRAIDIANVIVDKILNGEVALDGASLSAEIGAQTAAAGSTLTTVATWLLVFCWVASTVDAFRLGRRHDLAMRAQSSQAMSNDQD